MKTTVKDNQNEFDAGELNPIARAAEYQD